MRFFTSLTPSAVALCLAAAPALAAPSALPPAGRAVADFAGEMVAKTPAGPPVANGSNAAAGVVSTDPAKIALGVQIVGNFRFFDILVFGGKKIIRERPAFTGYDRELLASLYAEEMEKRRTDIIAALAAGNVDPYSIDQLNQLVALSKVKFVSDALLSGADPSLANPDMNAMTPAEQTLVIGLMDQAWVKQFLSTFDISPAGPAVQDAMRVAMARYTAAKTPQ